MKRRELLKFGLLGTMAVLEGTGLLKIYKHTTGVRKFFEYPASILRKNSTPVEAIDDKILSLSHQMVNTLLFVVLEITASMLA